MYKELAESPNDHQSDLFVCQFGEEECQPSHAYGPSVRDHYLIHFVASGCGKLHCDGRIYAVNAGQGFLICPDEETYYEADASTPWHYAWVGYRGLHAEALTHMAGTDQLHRVFSVADPGAAWHALMCMIEEARTQRLSQLSAVGNLLRFISLIAPAQDSADESSIARQYCEKAEWFLEGRFDRDVSIQETADFVGLSRSHLYRVMMSEYGCAPKTLLLRIRMRRAAQLLVTTSLTLEEIAHRVGLQTGAQLGAAFRSLYHISPGQYRRQHNAR